MEIPTRQFKVSGFTGKFSIDRKPSKMLSGEMKFQGYWEGGAKGHLFVYGYTREAVLSMLTQKIGMDI